MIGVGGHCLPKDGILLWWRRIESGEDTTNSLILRSRDINDESPAETLRLAEKTIGDISGKSVALLGAAYRFDSEDTRNAPTLYTAKLLLELGLTIEREDGSSAYDRFRDRIHDPYVKGDDQNLKRFGLTDYFTNSLDEALADAEVGIFCTGHGVYQNGLADILAAAPSMTAIIDGANLYRETQVEGPTYVGIGRGRQAPSEEFLDFVEQSFRVVEHGTANEVQALVDFLNTNYSSSEFNNVMFDKVQELSATCATGCDISDTKSSLDAPVYEGFSCRLATCASEA